MKPVLDRLTSGQRTLWTELKHTPKTFTLFGGIALTLRFGHRTTADFDFFCRERFDPEKLYGEIPYLKDSEVLTVSPNTLVCSVERGEPVKVSYFGLPDFGSVADPEIVDGLGLSIAPLIELAGTKTSVIQKRAAARDYLDLYFLLDRGGLSLLDALVAGRELYGSFFNPHVALKALAYFGDGNLDTLPVEVQEYLKQSADALDLAELSSRVERLT